MKKRDIAKERKRRIRRFQYNRRAEFRPKKSARNSLKIMQAGDDWVSKKTLATFKDAPDDLQFRDT